MGEALWAQQLLVPAHARREQQRATSQGPGGGGQLAVLAALPDLSPFENMVSKAQLLTELREILAAPRSVGPSTILMRELRVSEDSTQQTGEDRCKEDPGPGPAALPARSTGHVPGSPFAQSEDG